MTSKRLFLSIWSILLCFTLSFSQSALKKFEIIQHYENQDVAIVSAKKGIGVIAMHKGFEEDNSKHEVLIEPNYLQLQFFVDNEVFIAVDQENFLAFDLKGDNLASGPLTQTLEVPLKNDGKLVCKSNNGNLSMLSDGVSGSTEARLFHAAQNKWFGENADVVYCTPVSGFYIIEANGTNELLNINSGESVMLVGGVTGDYSEFGFCKVDATHKGSDNYLFTANGKKGIWNMKESLTEPSIKVEAKYDFTYAYSQENVFLGCLSGECNLFNANGELIKEQLIDVRLTQSSKYPSDFFMVTMDGGYVQTLHNGELSESEVSAKQLKGDVYEGGFVIFQDYILVNDYHKESNEGSASVYNLTTNSWQIPSGEYSYVRFIPQNKMWFCKSNSESKMVDVNGNVFYAQAQENNDFSPFFEKVFSVDQVRKVSPSIYTMQSGKYQYAITFAGVDKDQGNVLNYKKISDRFDVVLNVGTEEEPSVMATNYMGVFGLDEDGSVKRFGSDKSMWVYGEYNGNEYRMLVNNISERITKFSDRPEGKRIDENIISESQFHAVNGVMLKGENMVVFSHSKDGKLNSGVYCVETNEWLIKPNSCLLLPSEKGYLKLDQTMSLTQLSESLEPIALSADEKKSEISKYEGNPYLYSVLSAAK